MATVKQPIRARSLNPGETTRHWNTIRNAVSQTSLFRMKQGKGDVCTQAIPWQWSQIVIYFNYAQKQDKLPFPVKTTKYKAIL